MKSSDKLIEKVKMENVRPIPKWRFTLKNALILLALSACIVLGALAFSVILFTIQQIEFNLISHLSHSRLELLLGLLPFFWIISLFLFLLIATISFRKSKKGYKFSSPRLIGISTGFSILLGSLFFISGGAGWLEHAFSLKVEAYESVQAKKIKMWSLPEEGYLSGIISKVDGKEITLTDFSGSVWIISAHEANIPAAVMLEEGEQIKIIGEISASGHFHASEIRPWGGRSSGEHQGRRRIMQ